MQPMHLTFLFSLMESKLVLSWQRVWKMAASQSLFSRCIIKHDAAIIAGKSKKKKLKENKNNFHTAKFTSIASSNALA